MRSIKLRLLPTTLLLLAGGCAGGSSASDELASQPEIGVTHGVIEGYDQYLDKHLPLAFAVGQDGHGYAYVYCEGYHCEPAPQAAADAVSDCNDAYKKAEGHCVIFAVGRAKPRKYHLLD
jgi:hypothetical protein